MPYISICPNCKNPIPRVENGRVIESHVWPQLDLSTGEEFVPVNHVIGQQELIGDKFCNLSTLASLWPEDYTCFEPVAFVD